MTSVGAHKDETIRPHETKDESNVVLTLFPPLGQGIKRFSLYLPFISIRHRKEYSLARINFSACDALRLGKSESF